VASANRWNKPVRFCSRACLGASRNGRREFTCEACDRPFQRYLADIRKAERKGSHIRYCSKACENRTKAATNVERTCPQCDKRFTVWASRVRVAEAEGQRIFCSASCRDTTNGEEQWHRIAVQCTTCGKPMDRIPARVTKHMFCSPECLAAGVATWTRHGRGNMGYRPDIDLWCRSSWEANVARVLQALALPYAYESRAFRLPGGTSYRPDFHVAGLWIEVKGQMLPKAAAKIAAFREHYSDERLVVIGPDDYRLLAGTFGLMLPEWEHPWERWGERKYALRRPVQVVATL